MLWPYSHCAIDLNQTINAEFEADIGQRIISAWRTATMDKPVKSPMPELATEQRAPRFVHPRQSKLIGLWAATKMGLVAVEADAYARSIVRLDIEKVATDEVARKITRDLTEHGMPVTLEDIHRQMEELLPTAHHDWDV